MKKTLFYVKSILFLLIILVLFQNCLTVSSKEIAEAYAGVQITNDISILVNDFKDSRPEVLRGEYNSNTIGYDTYTYKEKRADSPIIYPGFVNAVTSMHKSVLKKAGLKITSKPGQKYLFMNGEILSFSCGATNDAENPGRFISGHALTVKITLENPSNNEILWEGTIAAHISQEEFEKKMHFSFRAFADLNIKRNALKLLEEASFFDVIENF